MAQNNKARLRSGVDYKPRNYFQNTRAEMAEFLPDNAQNIIEVGCGEGVFGQMLKKHFSGSIVWGIEIDAAAVPQAKKQLDRVLKGDIDGLWDKIPNNHFDLVVFNDVLEHMIDPYSVLKKIQTKLKPGGYIVSSIPNIRYYHTLHALVMAGEFEYQESGVLDRTHLRFFTQKSIRRMYERLGYNIVRHSGINPMPSPPLRFKFLEMLSKKRFDDMRYEQFATLAQHTKGEKRKK